MATPITPLTGNDTFKTWFDTTNTIISTVNGITTSPGGITGPYVISFNGLTGDVVFTNYVSNFNGATGAVSGLTGTIAGNGITITGTSTYPTISNSGVLSVNGAAGAVQNVAVTNAPQVFQTLQQFTGGISASGATFSGNISAPNVLTTNGLNVFTALQEFTSGISASGATFSGNISAPNIVNSYNGITGAVTGVSSFNGLTGAVTGVTTSVANTFTPLQTFTAGITSSYAYIQSLVAPVTTINTQCTITAPSFTIGAPNTIFSSASTQLITLPAGQVIKTLTTNTAATNTVSILEHAITAYSSAEFLIQGERYTASGGTLGTQTVKILMSATCGGNTYSVSHVEYGSVTNGYSVATYTIDLSGGTWRLRVTPTSSNSMRFRTVATLYPNVGGIGVGNNA